MLQHRPGTNVDRAEVFAVSFRQDCNSERILDSMEDNKRSWVIVGVWFGTIAVLGALKRILERQGKA
jgi:hypothetical protein